MRIETKVTGLTDVQRTLIALPKATRNKAMRPAMRRGAAVVRDAAAENLKAVADKGYATGLSAKSLRVYSMKMVRGMLRVGVMVKRGLVNARGVRVGLYVSVLEYGKEDQPPRSWARKAAREKPAAALAVITEETKKRIPAAVNEAKK